MTLLLNPNGTLALYNGTLVLFDGSGRADCCCEGEGVICAELCPATLWDCSVTVRISGLTGDFESCNADHGLAPVTESLFAQCDVDRPDRPSGTYMTIGITCHPAGSSVSLPDLSATITDPDCAFLVLTVRKFEPDVHSASVIAIGSVQWEPGCPVSDGTSCCPDTGVVGMSGIFNSAYWPEAANLAVEII